MTIAEFEEAVANGSQYVVLDEFVLDVSSFITYHPGGKFAINHNIGQDISKFFHGGYNLEGNLNGPPAPGHKHSNYARKIVNQLIIAQLDKSKIVQSTLCEVDKDSRKNVNPTTGVIFLREKTGQTVPNFRRFYPGLKMCGKHFTIRTDGKPTRHYTICNIMEPSVYAELLRLLKRERNPALFNTRTQDNLSDNSSVLSGDYRSLIDLLDTDDKDRQMFVIKNYGNLRGLSQRFFQDGDTFEVKGPMGKSLNVKNSGLHIAFAAGTGVLVFMDLVAQIAFNNLGVNTLVGEDKLKEDFKLHLYVSFQSREEAVALELLEALDSFCLQHGRTNFGLTVRISNLNRPLRWDAAWIQQQLSLTNAKGVKKVWVCGPPVMSETFDRAFSELKRDDPQRFSSGVLEVF